MLRTVRAAPKLLGEMTDPVIEFLSRQVNDDGGFRDRAGKSDLYYTVFGLGALIALEPDRPHRSTAQFVSRFDQPQGMDFVHLTCLARCWADLSDSQIDPNVCENIVNRLEKFRSLDGGYSQSMGSLHGSSYACFLALSAYQDMDREAPDQQGLLHCLESLYAGGGSYANEYGCSAATTPATSAAAIVRHHLGELPNASTVVKWLLTQHDSKGGFRAAPGVPLPDLLSTATALHALNVIGARLEYLREPCLDFVKSLRSKTGGFCGHWVDETADCEYTYYGLLALGSLAQQDDDGC